MVFSIRRIRTDDIDRLLLFRRKIFPDGGQVLDMDFWRWKYITHPYSKEIPFYIIESDDEIVGTLGYWPITLTYGAESVPCAHLMDFYVLDPFRGLPALAIFRKVVSNAGACLTSNLSEEARKLFKSAKWNDLSSQLYCCYHDISTPKSHFLKGAVRNSLRSLDLFLFKNKTKANKTCDSAIIFSKTCPEGVSDSFTGNNQLFDTAHFSKGGSYYRWRYDLCPIRSYEYVSAYNNSSLGAFIVFSFTNKDNIKKCNIMDIAYTTDEVVYVAEALIALFKYCEINSVNIIESTASTVMKNILDKSCFKCITSNVGFFSNKTLNTIFDKSLIDIDIQFMTGDTDVF